MKHPGMYDLERFDARVPGGRTGVHLARCASCRSTVAWMRDVRGVLHEAPAILAPEHAWASIQTRLHAGETLLLPSAGPRAPVRSRHRSVRAAAIVLLIAAAGAAAALPGSPLRTFVARTLDPNGFESQAAAPTESVPEAASPAPALTFSVAQESGAIEVAIEQPGAGLVLRVRWADGERLQLRAADEAAGARFRSSAGRLVVVSPGAGELVLTVPRGAPRVTVSVDGRPHLVQLNGAVTVNSPVADTIDGEIIIALPPAGSLQ